MVAAEAVSQIVAHVICRGGCPRRTTVDLEVERERTCTQVRNGGVPALFARGLRKTYRSVVALSGVDLKVSEGECFGLLGPNGAGKSTTLEICEGLLQPEQGEVEILGLRWLDHAKE